jgi:hypothetical protein
LAGKTGKFAEDIEIDCPRGARLAVGVALLFTLFVIRSSGIDTGKAHIFLNFPRLYFGWTLDLEWDTRCSRAWPVFGANLSFPAKGEFPMRRTTINFDPKGMTLDGKRVPIVEATLIDTSDGKFVRA